VSESDRSRSKEIGQLRDKQSFPMGCHPEQGFSRLYREKRRRRICGLLASASILNRRSFDCGFASAQDDSDT
jgi:hypothetical protein